MSFPRAQARAELAEALRRVVGEQVRFDSYTRHLFSRDASMYAIEPIGVVFPRDAADVAAVVATAGEFGFPVLPRGGVAAFPALRGHGTWRVFSQEWCKNS